MPRRIRLKAEGTERQIIRRRIAIGPIAFDKDGEEFISRTGKFGLERGAKSTPTCEKEGVSLQEFQPEGQRGAIPKIVSDLS